MIALVEVENQLGRRHVCLIDDPLVQFEENRAQKDALKAHMAATNGISKRITSESWEEFSGSGR